MICSFDNKMDAVSFANDLQKVFPHDLQSITITPQGKYVVSFAPGAINTLSDDTAEEQMVFVFLNGQVNI